MSLNLKNLSVDKPPEAKPGTPRPQRCVMLSICFKSGACTAFDYSHLYRIDFDGNAEIRLHFTQDVVTLGGNGFSFLLPLLLTHSVAELTEQDLLHIASAGAQFQVLEARVEVRTHDLSQ